MHMKHFYGLESAPFLQLSLTRKAPLVISVCYQWIFFFTAQLFLWLPDLSGGIKNFSWTPHFSSPPEVINSYNLGYISNYHHRFHLSPSFLQALRLCCYGCYPREPWQAIIAGWREKSLLRCKCDETWPTTIHGFISSRPRCSTWCCSTLPSNPGWRSYHAASEAAGAVWAIPWHFQK